MGETERAGIAQTLPCFTPAAPSAVTDGRAALPMMFSSPSISRAIRLIVSRRILPSTRTQSAPAAVKALARLNKSLWTNAPSPPGFLAGAIHRIFLLGKIGRSHGDAGGRHVGLRLGDRIFAKVKNGRR